MSGHALQYWLNHTQVFTSGQGLYESGGSGLAIKVVRWLFKFFGLTSKVRTFCNVETLNEQREMWPQIRRVLMSSPLHWAVIRTEWWAWKAGGVPPAQRQLIQDDYSAACGQPMTKTIGGQAMWDYVVNTVGRRFPSRMLDRLLTDHSSTLWLGIHYSATTITSTRFASKGNTRESRYKTPAGSLSYTHRCHPRYLGVKAHSKLSRAGAFDGLRIHTDEINEVIARITPSTLSVAVVSYTFRCCHCQLIV